MYAPNEEQALQVIDLIRQGRFIGEACDLIGMNRLAFYDTLAACPSIQAAKKCAQDFALDERRDEALRRKWEAYDPSNPKLATLVIWVDKTMFGLRETMDVTVETREPLKLFDVETPGESAPPSADG